MAEPHSLTCCCKVAPLLLAGKLLLGSSESSRQTVLSLDAVNAVNSVEVLDASDLEASGTTLAGSDGRIGEEVFPDLDNC